MSAGAQVRVREVSRPDVDPERLWGFDLDLPKSGTESDARSITIEGWILPKEGPAIAVELVSDSSVLQRVPFNRRRPDLAAAFPHVPEAEKGAFVASLELPAVTCEMELLVQAVLRDHQRVPLGRIDLELLEGEASHPDPARSEVDFGALRRLHPVGDNWGLDRGQPVDRYYIENFLGSHAQDIQGRVLEIGDSEYTLRFGTSISLSDTLAVEQDSSSATIIADLTDGRQLPSERYDCIICTQTLQYIYDVHSAIRTLYRILSPGGVLLATVPGVTQIGRDPGDEEWCWSFTALSLRRLCEEAFPATGITVETHGNVLSAVAFLHGIVTQELQPYELDHHDPAYQLVVTLRAAKVIDER